MNLSISVIVKVKLMKAIKLLQRVMSVISTSPFSL
nr:MAG TPA: hypothetical protein [Caudoviricetes sp.]